MCGIVGILGKGPVAENIVEALRRLDAVPSDRQNSGTRIARARIMDLEGANIEQVAEHARGVL